MGYRKEKEKIEAQIRKIKLIGLFVLLAIFLAVSIFSAFCPPFTWKYYVKKPDVTKRGDGELRIHFLDVGQADSILIELPDGKVALIDGGLATDTSEKAILRHLNALKIKTIDYLIVTHTDSDHCGGLKRVLECKNVLNAYLPATNAQDAGEAYAGFYQQLLEEDSAMHHAKRGLSMGNGDYTFVFLAPYQEAVEEDATTEETSLVVWLDYQGVSALFAGDAEATEEELLVRDAQLGLFDNLGVELSSTEILKVSHHGSAYSSFLSFLHYLNVEVGVVSCGENNAYGHPAEATVENFATVGADLFRTDKDGTVIVTVKPGIGYGVKTLKK